MLILSPPSNLIVLGLKDLHALSSGICLEDFLGLVEPQVQGNQPSSTIKQVLHFACFLPSQELFQEQESVEFVTTARAEQYGFVACFQEMNELCKDIIIILLVYLFVLVSVVELQT
jgi:hypothetical protein